MIHLDSNERFRSQSLSGKMPHRRKGIRQAVFSGMLVILAVILAAIGWYFYNLTPVNSAEGSRFFVVKQGDTSDVIAKRLKDEQFVRSELVTKIALRLSGKTTLIKAGKYNLSAASSVSQIIEKLESGKADVTLLTIVPGESLLEIKKRFVAVGFSKESVESSFAKAYSHPILVDKPTEASLEGYIYPDTYDIDILQSPEVVIKKSFDNFSAKLKQANLENAFTGTSLSLYKAIILASIIQEEAGTKEDAPKVAQVFLKRLANDMQLDSDATFVYAAREMGVAPSVTLDSPYNTRQVKGLPPTPIANFTIDKLQAVAAPSGDDYLYFVTADDNVTYYARTLPEHEQNVARHCGERCKL